MSLDASTSGYATHHAFKLVLCPDRRQRADRRMGPSRGGRRITDPPAEPIHAGPAKPREPQTDWFGLRMAASKLQATFRHMRLHMW